MDSVPPSYWQRTTPTVALASDLPSSVEVAVIGGGLLGTAACYWLARAGVPVALLEREALASGASGRNGGFVRIGSAGSYVEAKERLGAETARQVMKITTENRALLRQVLAEEAIACAYREPGSLRLALSEEQALRFRREIAELQADGYDARWLDRAQTQELIQTPLGDEIVGARFRPEQGLVHSALLVQGLAQAAMRHGASLYQAEVRMVNSEKEGLLLQTTQGTLLAHQVILAVNAWTSQLLPKLAPFLVPVLEQMLAYAPLPPLFTVGIGVDAVDGEYLQQTPDGSLLVGGCGILAPEGGVGIWDQRPLAVVQQALEQIVPRLFPQLSSHLRVAARWAGLMGCVSDAHPIVDRAEGLPGLFFVGGFSGHGMPFGLRLGQLLADSVTNGALATDLWAFRLDRPSLLPWSHL
ncbi:FAD-dependent oxidoreductase [Reticulibacter mediterranei]|uniref:FAD-dependent oxidoreductase n=1 Tax=Reticulibacter mediterranei TaxID=2778369 RepID=A0A8J3IRQ1_9CHLR|nr:FAD-binding oxidoreductase [Reticulibacter mediterranei]GHP00815.1 FAD-dependent oxidoreductase [Reticulibacter mediterranei]